MGQTIQNLECRWVIGDDEVLHAALGAFERIISHSSGFLFDFYPSEKTLKKYQDIRRRSVAHLMRGPGVE
jgi:hypothetical protein